MLIAAGARASEGGVSLVSHLMSDLSAVLKRLCLATMDLPQRIRATSRAMARVTIRR